MADFQQRDTITTLHALFSVVPNEEYLEKLEKKLCRYAKQQKIGLLLPCHFNEIANPGALPGIIRDLCKVRYLHRIVVVLGGTDRQEDFVRARRCFEPLERDSTEVKVIWVSGPRIRQVLEDLSKMRFPTGIQGKGQSVWAGLGYIFSRRDTDVVALHDCDIVTYSRLILARLVEPVANINSDYEFCKGYYPRISLSEKAMKGRVTRLFVFPFVDSMARIMREMGRFELERFFQFLQAFRYPLSGEFCFSSRLARGINIAHDWGLEVCTLSEVYGRIMPRKVVQIDLGINYEHKHQEISPRDGRRGLHRMVVDISKFFLHYLRSHGLALDDRFVEAACQTYYENALRMIKCYSDDAAVNGLLFDRHQEELTARYFRDFLRESWEEIKGDDAESVIPSWNRVLYSAGDIYSRLQEAVELDYRSGGADAG